MYVWCRRTDELVDGPNAARITPAAIDQWEERLEAIFAGRPYDELDACLTDTLNQFPLDIQPFRDMIQASSDAYHDGVCTRTPPPEHNHHQNTTTTRTRPPPGHDHHHTTATRTPPLVQGMRMDLVKSRYETFDELYEYCYRVAGTVGLMSMPVMGLDSAIDPKDPAQVEAVYRAALALGTANQLTNILRDVGEDIAERNRIYIPLEELDRFGIAEKEVVKGMFSASTGKIDDRWKAFMAFQIERTRRYFAEAEAGADQLAPEARWPVWTALILYRQILDGIEANDYNNFTTRAYVPKWRKMLYLPLGLMRANAPGLDLPGISSLKQQ